MPDAYFKLLFLCDCRSIHGGKRIYSADYLLYLFTSVVYCRF